MAISGTFLADFQQFDRETKNATATLEKFEAGGAKVDTQLKRMGATSDRTAVGTGTLTTQMRGFDGVLATMGVNTSTYTRALEDMERASGKSVAQLGKVATAGLIVGAGMAGWKLGRAAADFFDLDQKIGGATAKLLGWGDLAGEVAGANQDAMNLAFERTGIVAKDAGDALRINTEWLKGHTAAAKVAADEVTRLADEEAAALKVTKAAQAAAAVEAQKFAGAMAELNSVGATWQEELDSMNGSTVEAIRFYHEAGVANATLGVTYGETSEKIGRVVDALRQEEIALRAASQAETDRVAALAAAVDRSNAKLAADAATPTPNPGKYGTSIQYGAFNPTGGGELGSHARPDESFVVASGGGPAVTGPRPSGGGTTINVTNYVNGTAADVARQIEQKLIELAKLKGLLGGGTA